MAFRGRSGSACSVRGSSTPAGSAAFRTCSRLIAAGEVDASAIDSTVLETEFRARPVLRRQLRVIESWGPSPAPPWVASRRVPAVLRSQLRGIMLAMHREPGGRAILREARLARFYGVSDRAYDPIRHMARVAADAVLQRSGRIM